MVDLAWPTCPERSRSWQEAATAHGQHDAQVAAQTMASPAPRCRITGRLRPSRLGRHHSPIPFPPMT